MCTVAALFGFAFPKRKKKKTRIHFCFCQGHTLTKERPCCRLGIRLQVELFMFYVFFYILVKGKKKLGREEKSGPTGEARVGAERW